MVGHTGREKDKEIPWYIVIHSLGCGMGKHAEVAEARIKAVNAAKNR
jgi:hypothetical protein